jgi:hypothetical protein
MWSLQYSSSFEATMPPIVYILAKAIVNKRQDALDKMERVQALFLNQRR